jgi:hypothetical protein
MALLKAEPHMAAEIWNSYGSGTKAFLVPDDETAFATSEDTESATTSSRSEAGVRGEFAKLKVADGPAVKLLRVDHGFENTSNKRDGTQESWADLAESDGDEGNDGIHVSDIPDLDPALQGLTGARANGKGLSTIVQAALYACGLCGTTGLHANDVCSHAVDGKTTMRCCECCATKEGCTYTKSGWKRHVGKTKGFRLYNRDAPVGQAVSKTMKAMALDFYCANKEAILEMNKEEQHKYMGFAQWFRAVKAASKDHTEARIPLASECLDVLRRLNETLCVKRVAMVVAALDFMPLIMGDGKCKGTFIIKYFCSPAPRKQKGWGGEVVKGCGTMPLRDGEWFLLKKSGSGRTWLCAHCGVEWEDTNAMLVGIIWGDAEDEVTYMRAMVPDQNITNFHNMLKLVNNTCSVLTGSMSNIDFIRNLMLLIFQSELKARFTLAALSFCEETFTVVSPNSKLEQYVGSSSAGWPKGPLQLEQGEWIL